MTAALVLAAGRSDRMARRKAELTLPSGETFLEAILGTLTRSGISTVRVVVPPGSLPEAPGAPGDATLFVVNPDPARGMLSSVRCGLEALPAEMDALLLWPVDHPRVCVGTIVSLVATHRAHRATIVVPVHGGRRGHPVLFAGSAIAELWEAPESEGARAIVHAHTDRIELPVADPAILDDVDTPEDYARLAGDAPGFPIETP